MKVMIVCSGNMPEFSFEKNQSFIFDQAGVIKALNLDITFSYFFIRGKGAFRYLRNFENVPRESEVIVTIAGVSKSKKVITLGSNN